MPAPKKELNLLWVFGALGGIFIIFLAIADAPLGFLSTATEKPKAGEVFILTEENLAAVRRDTPVLVALYTRGGDSGARLSRLLPGLATEYKDTAIVALGNTTEEPDLHMRATLTELPAFIIYRGGKELQRRTGDDADDGLRQYLTSITSGAAN
jgi:thioredoxin-like negative regulator of GroEL